MADLFQFRQQDDITLIPEPRRKHGTIPMAREGCECEPCASALRRYKIQHAHPKAPKANLDGLVNEEAWVKDAACRGMDPDWFHPERGDSTQEQKAVCAKCPVREDCLDYAMRYGQKIGIWGGASERERRILRRTWSRAA